MPWKPNPTQPNLQGWFWLYITHESSYAMKQTKPNCNVVCRTLHPVFRLCHCPWLLISFTAALFWCHLIYKFELPWPENPTSTTYDIWKHWTVVSTSLGLITSVYRDLPTWRSNQQPQNAEPKLYHWATGPHGTKVMPN